MGLAATPLFEVFLRIGRKAVFPTNTENQWVGWVMPQPTGSLKDNFQRLSSALKFILVRALTVAQPHLLKEIMHHLISREAELLLG